MDGDEIPSASDPTSHKKSQPTDAMKTKIQLKYSLKPQSSAPYLDNSGKGKGTTSKLTPDSMEEEPQRIDYGYLDIIGLEDACKRKEFLSIPNQQIQKLEEVLTWAQ